MSQGRSGNSASILPIRSVVSTYVYHADATDPLTDTPTVRLLRRLAALDQSHVAWGQAVLESLTQSAEDRRRALEVQADIEGRLVACGGVTGQGIESHWLAFHSAKAEERPAKRPQRLSRLCSVPTRSVSFPLVLRFSSVVLYRRTLEPGHDDPEALGYCAFYLPGPALSIIT